MKGIEALAPAIGKFASSISDSLFEASWLILLLEPRSLVQLSILVLHTLHMHFSC